MLEWPSFPTLPPLLPNFPITTHIPRHSLNIVAGPPNAGKSKLLQTAVRSYLHQGEWLGTQAPQFDDLDLPLPMAARVGYIGGVSLDFPPQVPQILWQDYKYDRLHDDRPLSLEFLYDQFPEPRPQLLLVDRFQSLMPGGKINDYCEVERWCSQLARWRKRHDVTIIGTAPTAKVKSEKDAYAPHDRIMGSIGWAQASHTSFLLSASEPPVTNLQQPASYLLITLTHGPYPRSYVYYDIDAEGWLVPTLEPPVCFNETEWRVALTATVSAHGAEPIRTAQILEWGEALDVSKATVERWIADEPRLQKISKGVYKWVDKPMTSC